MKSCPFVQQVINLRFRIIPAGLYFIGKIVDRQKQFFRLAGMAMICSFSLKNERSSGNSFGFISHLPFRTNYNIASRKCLSCSGKHPAYN